MKSMRVAIRELIIVSSILAAVSTARADWEKPNTSYLPTANYYSSVTATDSTTLKNQLYNVMTPSNFKEGGYDNFNSHFIETDTDLNNSSNIILVYTGASVSGTWDKGSTFNKEHLWVNDRLPDTINGDWFNIRPCNPKVNSTRNNFNYGRIDEYGNQVTGAARLFKGQDGNSYWYAGDADKGDVARSLFYMATKYKDSLMLINGNPMTKGSNKEGDPTHNQMGDLTTLLHWNYEDGVDNFERRRNTVIQGTQNNRNAYIDHPEYVWAVFGGGNNNSQVTLKSTDSKATVSTSTATGQSTANVNLGRVFTNASIGTASVTIDKKGDNPTTYDINATGNATVKYASGSAADGTGQTIDYNDQTRAITVGLNASTSTAGLKSGKIVVNNTDLTSSGAGHGSQDADDTINVTATVVDHAKASLNAASQKSSMNLDFGTVNVGDVSTLTFTISNLVSTADYTAMLDLDKVALSGSSVFSTDATATKNIIAGTGVTFSILMNTLTVGDFSGIYTLTCSDEDLTGALTSYLTVNVHGAVSAVPEPASILMLGFAGSALLMRRRKA